MKHGDLDFREKLIVKLIVKANMRKAKRLGFMQPLKRDNKANPFVIDSIALNKN